METPTPAESRAKKIMKAITIIVVIMLIVVLGLNTYRGWNNGKKLHSVAVERDSLYMANADLNNRLEKCKDGASGTGGVSVASLESKVDSILNCIDCSKKKSTAGVKSPHAKTGGAKAARTKTGGSTTTIPTRNRTIVPADNSSRTENTGLCGDQYIGVYNGSHGVTINEESKLVYFVSNAELNAGEGKLMLTAPQLNGANSGNDFYWDAGKKLWVFESNTIITIARLLSGTPIVWCVYLGNHEQWGYPMFTPHEIIKTGSSSARSALANGEIKLHNPNNIDEGADYVSAIQFKKR